MKVSIITPSYNQVRFLEKTILSIWNQEGDFELEHIIADGGSTDGSIDLIKKYDHFYKQEKFKYSCRSFSFLWWSRDDKGQSDAINQGFEKSSGQILGWLNSDDTFSDHQCLATVVQVFSQNTSVDFVIGNAHNIDENDNRLDIYSLINTLDNSTFQARLKILPKYNLITQPACFFRRSIWEKHGVRNDMHYMMDWALWISAYRDGAYFYKINRYLANNRIYRDTKTASDRPERFTEALKLFNEYDVICFNRFSFYLNRLMLNLKEKNELAKIVISFLVMMGKKFRNFLIKKLKIY